MSGKRILLASAICFSPIHLFHMHLVYSLLFFRSLNNSRTTLGLHFAAAVLTKRDYVRFRSLLSQIRVSVVCLSSVSNVHAPYSAELKRSATFFRHFVH